MRINIAGAWVGNAGIYPVSTHCLLSVYSLSTPSVLTIYLHNIFDKKFVLPGLVGAVYKYLDNIYTLNIYSISIHYLLTLYSTSVTKSVGWLAL